MTDEIHKLWAQERESERLLGEQVKRYVEGVNELCREMRALRAEIGAQAGIAPEEKRAA